MLTNNFDHLLWKGGIGVAFPNAPQGTTRVDVHRVVERIRAWRNMVAHHYAIFDRGPTTEFNRLLNLVLWIDAEMHWLTKEVSRVGTVINQRPRA